MTMAQFSRDDILPIRGGKKDERGSKEEGREEDEKKGKNIGVIHTYQKLGNHAARQYIVEEFGTNAAEADELLRTYWI